MSKIRTVYVFKFIDWYQPQIGTPWLITCDGSPKHLSLAIEMVPPKYKPIASVHIT